MLKEDTRNYYQEKIKNILLYINDNLEKELTIKQLAEQSNISTFHFHRIVKACLGVPLGTYINHLRLDTAARLLKYSNENVSDIAIKIGYNDLSAFSKSFSREFGISPSDYRENKDSRLSSHIDFSFNRNKIERYPSEPKIKTIPPRKIYYTSAVGKYGGKECIEAWNLIMAYASKNKLLSWNTEAFSIYYDDPDMAGMDNCRFDICLTTRREVKEEERIKSGILEGGKFMIYRYKGPYDNLWDVYSMLYQEYIINDNKYIVRDAPTLEKYVRYSEKTKPEDLITEIYIPLAL